MTGGVLLCPRVRGRGVVISARLSNNRDIALHLVLVELVDYISRVNVRSHEGDNDLPLKLGQVSSNLHDQLRELHDIRFVPPENNTKSITTWL